MMFVLCFHHGVLGVSRSLVLFAGRMVIFNFQFSIFNLINFQLIIDTAKIPPQKREVKHFGIYFREYSVLEVDFSKPFCKCCES